MDTAISISSRDLQLQTSQAAIYFLASADSELVHLISRPAQNPPRPRAGVPPPVENHGAIDNDILHANRRLGRPGESRAVGNAVVIENNDVGCQTLRNPTSVVHVH